jgi:hypothetical protein
MLALHRRAISDEDMFVIPSVFDKVTIPYEFMWPDALRLIITLFSKVLLTE